jgi:hypothetical protein
MERFGLGIIIAHLGEQTGKLESIHWGYQDDGP